MVPLEIKSYLKNDKHSRFETLLVEISTLFISLPVDQIDGKIEDAQRRICTFLGIDRSTLWQVDEQAAETLLLTHCYQPPEVLSAPYTINANDLFPWVLQKMINLEVVSVSKMSDLPPAAVTDRKSFSLYGAKSGVYLPLSMGNGPLLGVLTFASTQVEISWPAPLMKRMQLVAQIFTNALERKRMDGQCRANLSEIKNLKHRLEQENLYLQEEVQHLVEHSTILGQSAPIKTVLSNAAHVAKTDSTVLILGETGTGKELLARAIHNMSLRKDRPLVTINCASLPPSLIENELFGREKGAYTGAMTKMVGRFELADGSTLFLDEIGELPLDLQSKILRVLEEGTLERLGSTKPLKINVRIIAATNRDIEQEVNTGRFRQDLFYRLNVFPIVVPPLRDRSEDIPLLIRAFVREFEKKLGKQIQKIPHKTMQSLQAYLWPGNVRELRNIIERAMIISKDKTLTVHLPKTISSKNITSNNLEDMMRKEILSVLKKTHWRISGQNGAAEILGLKRSTLYSKMKKLGIRRTHS